MSDASAIPPDETGFDRLFGFTIPDRHVRGRVVRLGPALDEILDAHPYPPAAKCLLAEALVLTALMGGLLKDADAQMTLQAQSPTGVVSLLVCDYRQGELRGYLQFDAERLAGLGANPSIQALLDGGYLAVTFDLGATGQRYQGIVPLEGASLGEACENYFIQSEQVPTLIRLGVRSDGAHCVAGGLLVQHLAEGEEGRERLHVRLTIRNGNTWRYWRAAPGMTSWWMPACRSMRWSGACSMKKRRCACSRARKYAADAAVRPIIIAIFLRVFRKLTWPTCAMNTAKSLSIAHSVRGCFTSRHNHSAHVQGNLPFMRSVLDRPNPVGRSIGECKIGVLPASARLRRQSAFSWQYLWRPRPRTRPSLRCWTG